MVTISAGYVHPRFEAVREAFANNFVAHGEVAAAVHVIVRGEVVADLWAGWPEDAIVDSYSVGKAIVSLLLLQLVDDGRVELDAPVAAYWPDFTSTATVRQALCHQAGVPAIREKLTNDDLWDFDRMCDAVAATEPWWVPGEQHAYHTNTFGHLIGGLVRKVTGELPGTRLSALAREIDADLHFGVGDDDLARCADVLWVGGAPPADVDVSTLDMTTLGYVNPPGYSSMGVVNTREWRQAQVPSTNGHMSARGVARFYDAVLRRDLLSPALLREATKPQSSGWCPTLGQDVTFGLGFQPWTERRPFGRTPGSFGHFGTGGSLGFADPTAGVAFGYVMNHVIPRWQSPRNRALVDAVYASL